jgi:phosphomannomutase
MNYSDGRIRISRARSASERYSDAIFRAYDIRGKYPGEINEKVISKIIFSFISKFKISPSGGSPAGRQNSKFKIVVGHDARLSSPSLYKTVLKSLVASGYPLAAIKAGLITTPTLSFLVNYYKADLGIMITASHNPKEYNGLKIVGKNAVPISGKEIYKTILSFL